MALYDAPVPRDYEVLTHRSAGRNYSRNGYGQVGNKVLPANDITASSIKKSAIYNKGISGISEAGYGRMYPNPPGLSAWPRRVNLRPGSLRYSGAGSYGEAGSRLAYSGAGSYGAAGSRTRKGMAYSGAGSYGAAGSRLAYSGAGSYGAAGSRMRDAYINDNPPVGTLRGLNDDPAPTDTGTEYGPSLPGGAEPTDTSGGFLSTISSAFSNILKTSVATAASVGQGAVSNAVSNAINPPPKPPSPVTVAMTTVKKALPTTVLGMSIDTALLVGAGVGAYYLFKKK